jgi:hypothetical protein
MAHVSAAVHPGSAKRKGPGESRGQFVQGYA